MEPISITTSIVICTYNRSSLLNTCIESLSKMDHDFEQVEVVVIDNNSKDDTRNVCSANRERYPFLKLRYVLEEKQGIGHARTRGAREAKGEIIAYIDDDCKAESDWLKSIEQFYREHPEAYSTGGAIQPDYNVSLPDWYGRYFWGLVGYYNLGGKVFRMQGVRYPSGANMHFRKKAFEDFGYFDGELGRKGQSLMAGEEKAMYLKLIGGDKAVYYLPHVKVWHFVDANKFDKAYVRRHSIGIGASERLMNRKSGYKLVRKFAEYLAKLGYAIAYGIGYLFKGEVSKMVMLVKFRWWVIEGFLYPDRT